MSRARFIASLTSPDIAAMTTLEMVCRRHGITRQQIMLPGKRNMKISAARHEAYSRLYEITKSKSEVARIMGKDHTTVLHGIKTHLSRNQGKELVQ